jgi:hypothetical protein
MPEDPIGVRPTNIPLGGLDGSLFGQFMVSNRTSDPYWQVWIKITVRPKVLDPQELQVGILESSRHASRTQRVGDWTVETDYTTDDDRGNRAKFLMIQEMRPSEYISHYVRIAASRGETGFQVCIDLVDVSFEPLVMPRKGGKPVLHFPFPSALKGETSFRVKATVPIEDS